MTTHDFLRDIKIYQNKGGYRFSVDALLVYSFITLPRVKTIADLGAGSGIIGLLLARKYPEAGVTLIELQESLVRLAERNVAANGLRDRVTVVNADITHITAPSIPSAPGPPLRCGEYDLVVSNPPYRRARSGKLSIDDERAIARHELKVSLPELVRAASALLRHHGRFCVIHLPERLAEVVHIMKGYGIEPKRLRLVHSTIGAEAKMVLVEAVKGARSGLKVEPPLIIYEDDGSYSEEMKMLYNAGEPAAGDAGVDS